METRSTRAGRPRSRRPPTSDQDSWLAGLVRDSGLVVLAVDNEGVVRAMSEGARMAYGDLEGKPSPVPGRGLVMVSDEARELDAFVYGASHDLQEPLRKVVAFGELLERRAGPALDAASLDFLKRMRDAASRMTGLIQDLLRLSRAGREGSAPQDVELGPMMSELAATLDLKLELGPLPAARGRPEQLRAAFLELLENAAKFKGDKPAFARVTGRVLGDGRVEVQLSDHGVGFTPEQAERIFQPFVRLHPRHEYEGAGIGLALARKLLAANGATVTAKGEPGKGATFTVCLSSRPD